VVSGKSLCPLEKGKLGRLVIIGGYFSKWLQSRKIEISLRKFREMKVIKVIKKTSSIYYQLIS